MVCVRRQPSGFPASVGSITLLFGANPLWLGVGAGLCTLFAGGSVLMMLGRLQIRENGLWCYWAILPWRNLVSFEWKGNTLMIRSSGFGLWGRGDLPIHPDQIEKVDRLLRKYAGRKPFADPLADDEGDDASWSGGSETGIQVIGSQGDFRP